MTDFAVGDLVSGEGHVVCGRCRNCMAGRRHLCAHSIGLGVQRPGAFAEFVALPMTNIWHHWPGIDEDVAAIFDPFGNAVHTALSFAVLGEDVLITGAGPIGCMATAVVRHAGARHVVVTDVNPYRLELARRMGATLAVDPGAVDLREVQARARHERGLRCGLEMSGHAGGTAEHDRRTWRTAAGSRCSASPRRSSRSTFDPIIFNMLTLKGIYGREMYETWYQMTVMVQSGLDISPVITHRFPYSEFEEAFAVARSGQSGKVMLDWTAI